nr:hypothetical protein [Tanacetum cinerariifolium]
MEQWTRNRKICISPTMAVVAILPTTAPPRRRQRLEKLLPGSGVVDGGDSGWSSDEWRWCSGGAGCRKAAAVGMVTDGSGVLMVAVGGLDR